MSEDQANYITESEEALEMLSKGYENAAEIHPPKTIQVIRDNGLEEYKVWGWVKVSANFVHHIRKLKGAKLAIWQVIALSIDESGGCSLTIHEIAELSGYSYSETHQSLKELDEMGYLSIQKESGKKSLYSPNFAARGQNQPNDDHSRKTRGIPLQSSGGHPSSPALEKYHPSIKELKELIEEEEATDPKNIYLLYSEEIGVITPSIADALKDWENDVPEKWIKDAILEASANGARNWKYVQAILKRWHEQGHQGENKPAKKNGKKRATPKELVPVELSEQELEKLREYAAKEMSA